MRPTRFGQCLLLAATIGLNLAHAADGDVIHLLCEGEVNSRQDEIPKGVERSALNLTLIVASKVAMIDGQWGCMASMFHSSDSAQTSFINKCTDVLAVNVSDESVKYQASSEDDKGSGTGSFVLNRYSGTLRTMGIMMAKPALRANWSTFIKAGEFKCERQDKRF